MKRPESACFFLEHAQHLALLNSKYGARRHRSSCRHADSLTRKACLTKEVARPQNCEDRFFALFGGAEVTVSFTLPF